MSRLSRPSHVGQPSFPKTRPPQPPALGSRSAASCAVLRAGPPEGLTPDRGGRAHTPLAPCRPPACMPLTGTTYRAWRSGKQAGAQAAGQGSGDLSAACRLRPGSGAASAAVPSPRQLPVTFAAWTQAGSLRTGPGTGAGRGRRSAGGCQAEPGPPVRGHAVVSTSQGHCPDIRPPYGGQATC